MRNKVRKSLAFLLALALVVSVMSGLGLSVSAEQESNTPGTEEVQQQDKTEAGAAPSEVKAEEEAAKPEEKPVQEEKKDEQKTEAKENADKPAEKQEKATPKAGENVQTATIGTGDKTVTVKTTAAAGVLPEGAKLVVKKLANQDQAYQDAESTLKDSQVTYDDFLALDVGFEVNGKEVEPEAGSVQVQFELGAGLLPKTADTSTLAVQHLTDGKAETVADAGAVTAGDVTVKNEAVKADFEVKSFSTFTITWSVVNGRDFVEKFKFTVKYVDVNGKEINPSATNVELGDGTTINFEEKYGKSLSSYNWVGAYYGDYTLDGENNKKINTLTTSSEWAPIGLFSGYYKYYNVVMKNASGETVYNETVNGKENTVKEANITLVYAIKASTGGTGGSISTQQNISHEKYVVDKKDGTYDLNLTVVGARGTETKPAKLDVLLIVDVSSSMEGSNISGAKGATETLTDALKNRKDIDAKYSVVTFGKTAKTLVSWEQGTASNVVDEVNKIEIQKNVGTNYQAGFREAKKQLNLARSDAQTVVIFLTDGWPTYYIGADGWTAGGGSSTYQETLDASNQEASGMYVNQFYAIGVGDDMTKEKTIAGTSQGGGDPGKKTTGAKILEAICKEVHTDKDKSEYHLSSASELSKLFDDIAGKTRELLCTKVKITDTLSDNVKPVESVSGTPKDLIVTVKKGDKDGKLVATAPKEVTIDGVTISAKYEDGQIMLIFPETYTLNPEYTYIVTANIEATEMAYQHVREHDGTYPNRGEKGTGTTSEDQGGVFTNTKAEVTYFYNDVKTTEDYNNPVIQPKPAKLIVKKTISGLESLSDEQIKALEEKMTFDITYTYPSGTTQTETQPVKLSQFTKDENGTYTYTNDKVWSMGATYTVTESANDVSDYDCRMTSSNANNVTIPKYGEATATFTNAYTPSAKNLTIQKKIEGDQPTNLNAEFTFEVAGPANGNYTIEGTDKKATFTNGKATVTITGASSITIENLPLGAYTVKETSMGNVNGYTWTTAESAMSDDATLSADANGTVIITNTLKKNPTVTIVKKITGNMSDSSDEFTFTYGDNQTVTLNGGDKNTEKIEVPYGSSFTVTESDKGGYTLDKIEATGSTGRKSDDTYTIEKVTEDTTITFTTTKTIQPPNGIITTIAPYAIMVVLAAGAGVYFVYSRRRRNR